MHHMVEIHAPVVVQPTTMVYDTKDHLINTSTATRAGISKSDHHFTYGIWFDDGEKRHYMRRVFDTKEEAQFFLESIYNIKE